MKQVADATNDVAGKGTTRATILTRTIFTEGCKSVAAGMNAMDLRCGIIMAVDTVVANLKIRARMINTLEEIAQVGIISSNGDAWVEMNDQHYSPSQIGAFVFTKVKENAEAYLGKSISKAIIIVPTNFDDAQRQATKDAGRIISLGVLRIINEPTSGAIREAMEQAQARLKYAKELMGRKCDKQHHMNVGQPKVMNGRKDGVIDEVEQKICTKVVVANNLLKENNSMSECDFLEKEEIHSAEKIVLNQEEKKLQLHSSREDQQQRTRKSHEVSRLCDSISQPFEIR